MDDDANDSRRLLLHSAIDGRILDERVGHAGRRARAAAAARGERAIGGRGARNEQLRCIGGIFPAAEQERASESDCIEQVFEAELVAMRNRATSSFEQGEFVAAAKQFVEVLLRDPDCVKSNFNLAVILDMLGETCFAVHFMLHVITLDDTDSVAHTVLRTVYFQQEPDAVLAGYRSIIARFPHHVRAVHSLATLQGEAETAAPAYVREVFDELAETFEEKLVTHLEYRVPWLLIDALKKHEPTVFSEVETTSPTSWRVADVGCGTGLCGRLLRPYVAHIAGVDISPLMIEKTREAGSYDELQTEYLRSFGALLCITADDIGPFLSKREDASLDLVISADVWIYVGALETIFALCAQKLKTQGWLVFSTELLASEAANGDVAGFKLAASGRFQHSEAYIATLTRAHGFRIVHQDAIDVRKESGEAIRGCVYLLQNGN
ncbi:Cellulose synthase subunit, partial [Globisporangium splendens]